MKVCYLVNQYPKVSHSFIRREILELEHSGTQVLRIALRGWKEPVVDAGDRAELSRTLYILRAGSMSALLACALTLLRTPGRTWRAFMLALRLNRTSDKSLLKHLVCLAEGAIAARWIRAAQVEHLHAHFGTNSAEVAMQAALLAGVPYSFTVHGPEEFDHPAGLCLPEKIRRAAAVVAISSFGRSQLLRWADAADWPKVAVVHCGLDEQFLAPVQWTQPVAGRLVCVGRLCEQKGQLILLEALRRVLDAGHSCQLVLAGDGEMRAQLEARAHELGIAPQVRITGWLDSASVREEILAARALVLPSFAEGLPVVLMEALALQRPVITTYVAGIPELVEHGECGWLVPAGDADRLAQAMIDCLSASGERTKRMGEQGRTRVLARHDIRIEARKLAALFRAPAA